MMNEASDDKKNKIQDLIQTPDLLCCLISEFETSADQ